MKKRIRQFEKAGFKVLRTGGGYLKLLRPDLIGQVFVATTPSDVRADENLRALLKRIMRPREVLCN